MASTSSTPSVDRSPKSIGPYAIRARIGRGAMGVVYSAIDERTRSEVALKVIAGDMDGDPETRERFFREAHVAGKLRHRNVVAVFDSGEDGGRLYIAMELLSGATLNELLKERETTDLEDHLDVMIQVCQGLAVAHAAGVYHRDIKPANLFVCDDGRVKILDFGVARLIGSNMTLTGNIIGTPDFMAPEQVRGRDVDERSDIFSAASVFYLLLTGRKPFAASDLPAVLNKVLRTQPLAIREDEAPEVVADVIRKAMSKDPEARQQTVAELATDLMRAASRVAETTREEAKKTRRLAEDLCELSQRRVELAAALHLDDAGVTDTWALLIGRFPLLRHGPAALEAFPVRSATVRAIADALVAALAPLRPLVEALETAHTEWTAGAALQAQGAHESAAARYASAHRALPGSPVIRRAIETCAATIEEHREREVQLESRLTLAREASARQDWAALLAIADDIDEIDAGNSTAERLRLLASQKLETMRARREHDRARQLPAPAVTPLASASPADLAVSRAPEIDNEEVVARTQRLAQAALLGVGASKHLTEGNLVEAERLAAQAVALNGEDRQARRLLERARTSITLQGRRDETFRVTTDLLQRAHDAADRKNFDQALSLLDEVMTIDAAHAGAASLRARVIADRIAHEAEEVADAVRQRRARAAAPALHDARRALKDGDLGRARWAAENALALAPGAAEVLAVLAQIDAVTPSPAPDDTVVLDDPNSDTAHVAAYSPSMQDRVTDLREHASSMLRRWRTPESASRD